MLELLGDDYISQHIQQGYREYVEQTSYKVYMSNMVKEIACVVAGVTYAKNWSDILADLDGSTAPETKAETEQEVKSRLLAKLNGREGE